MCLKKKAFVTSTSKFTSFLKAVKMLHEKLQNCKIIAVNIARTSWEPDLTFIKHELDNFCSAFNIFKAKEKQTAAILINFLLSFIYIPKFKNDFQAVFISD